MPSNLQSLKDLKAVKGMKSLTYTVSEIIRFSSIFSIGIPLAVYLARLKIANKEIHIIGAIVIVSMLCDIIGFLLGKNHIPTAPLTNTYFILFFFLLSWYYYQILFAKKFRVIFLCGTGFYIGSFIIVTLLIQNFLQNQSLMWSVTGLIFIIYSIIYFRYLFLNTPVIHIHTFTPMWINSAVLFYFGFNFGIFLMSHYLLSKIQPEIAALTWSFHNLNNIIKNILFAVAIYLCKREKL